MARAERSARFADAELDSLLWASSSARDYKAHFRYRRYQTSCLRIEFMCPVTTPVLRGLRILSPAPSASDTNESRAWGVLRSLTEATSLQFPRRPLY